ncbi:MAG: PEP-utilizing enzyme [Acidimicrobiales bacterium]
MDDALDAMDVGGQVVLALVESAPGDVPAMVRAAAVITARGGPDSHAAIVTRAAGVPCVVGVEGLEIDDGEVRLRGVAIALGSPATVDGTTGTVALTRATPAPSVDSAPTVVGIQLAKASRLGMRAVDQADIETNAGLVGDRYHGSRHRQLSVQSLEELAEAEAAFGQPIDPLLTRRNITIDRGRIPRTPGHRWKVGDVELEVVRDAAPCKMLDMEIGDGARTAMRRRAGVICRVIEGAALNLGDPVDLGDPEQSRPAEETGPPGPHHAAGSRDRGGASE